MGVVSPPDGSDGSGCIGVIVLVGLIALLFNACTGKDPWTGKPNQEQRERTEYTETIEEQKVYDRPKSVCELWAESNPTLADRLQPGDHCYR